MGAPAPNKSLRLWPGVAAVVLLFLARFGTKLVIPGFQGFSNGMMASLAFGAVILLWWLFFSRAAWGERLGALALLALSIGSTWQLKHESMGPLWLVGYLLPTLFLAFVAWAVATRDMDDRRRRLTMVVAILAGGLVWTLARTEGINGDHDARFAWRFSPTAEERLLAEGEERSAGQARATAADVDPDGAAHWPGFRGADRAGVARVASMGLDWATSPPRELWRRPVGPAWSSFAVRGALIFTQEQLGDQEAVSAYDRTTGELVWRHGDAVRFFESNAGAGPRSTPTLDGDRVFAFGATGLLNALDVATGAAAWSRDVAADTGVAVPDWGFSSSPLVHDGRVIVAASGQLVAYARENGDLLWRDESEGGSYSSPHLVTIDGVVQVVLMRDEGTASLDPVDGTMLWEHEWGGSPMVQPAQVDGGDLLLVAHERSGVRRLDVSAGPDGWSAEELWTSNGLKPYFNDFVTHEGHAYGFDGRILSCIELGNGERQWKGGRYGNGQLVLLPEQDLLLVLTEKGELALVRAQPDGFEELHRLPAIEGKTWNHPVVVDDLLLARNGEEMVAYRLPVIGGRTADARQEGPARGE